MILISNFLFNICYFCVIVCFLTKLLTSGILFSTAVNAELVAKLAILGILFSTSVILEFKSVFLAKSLLSRVFLFVSLIFFSKSYLSVSYVVFKTNRVVSVLSTFATNLS